jgi:hypothetical protein
MALLALVTPSAELPMTGSSLRLIATTAALRRSSAEGMAVALITVALTTVAVLTVALATVALTTAALTTVALTTVALTTAALTTVVYILAAGVEVAVKRFGAVRVVLAAGVEVAVKRFGAVRVYPWHARRSCGWCYS